MKRLSLFALFMLLTLAAIVPDAAGETASLYTSGLCNGRFWTQIASDVKLGYVIGLREGVTISNAKENLDFYGIAGATNNEIVSMISGFYTDGANMNIPIIFAYQFVAMKFAGSSEEALAERVTVLRQSFNKSRTETQAQGQNSEEE